MLLSKRGNLENTIVEVLISHPGSRADFVHQAVCRSWQKVTLRVVYKWLKRLESDGVINKVNEQYRLNMSWIVNLSNLAYEAETIYLAPRCLEHFLGKEKKGVKWKYHYLKMVDYQLTDLCLRLQPLDGAPLLAWHPHPWFYLFDLEREARMQRSFDAAKLRFIRVIGGEGYLDRYYEKLQSSRHSNIYSRLLFPGVIDTHYILSCDNLVTMRLGSEIACAVDQLFRNVKGARDVNYKRIRDILDQRCNVSISLERGTPRVRQVRKAFSEFLGPGLK